MLVHRLHHLVVPVLTIGILLWCVHSLQAETMQTSYVFLLHSWDVLLVAIGLSLLNYALRIVRWSGYLKVLGHPLRLGFSALTYIAGFAFTLTPGKVGEMARARYYLKANVALSTTGAAFFVERLMDTLAILALAAVSLLQHPRYSFLFWAACGAIVAALAILSLFKWDSIMQRLSVVRQPEGRVVKLGLGILRTFSVSRRLLTASVLVVGLLLGVGAWAAEGVGLGIIASIFAPPHLDFSAAIGIYAVATLAGALAFLPGGLGGTEVVMAALLVGRGFAMGDALLVTLACRIVTLWLAVALGWLAVLILRGRIDHVPFASGI